MDSNDLRTKQFALLEEIYPTLYPVAANVTRHPGIAEEALSEAVVSIVGQIRRGVCRATDKAQFCKWVNRIVQTQAKRAIGGGTTGTKHYSSDVLIDRAAERLRQEPNPDAFRDGRKPSLDDLNGSAYPFRRTETLKKTCQEYPSQSH